MHKLRKVLVTGYVIFLILSFFYVRSVLEGVPVSVEDTSNTKNIEYKPVKVSLTVKGPSINKTYSHKLNSNDSISDLLLVVKEENTDFTFDKISYSYGSELEHVNNIKNTLDMKWKIYDGTEDVTLQIDSTKLKDGKNYTLIYENSIQTSTPQ